MQFLYYRFIFEGNVTITIACEADTDNVTLNMDDLNITSITMEGPSGAVPVSRRKVDRVRVMLIIFFKEQLRAGEQYNLTMTYNGVLRNNLIGIYQSSYQTSTGELRYVYAMVSSYIWQKG